MGVLSSLGPAYIGLKTSLRIIGHGPLARDPWIGLREDLALSYQSHTTVCSNVRLDLVKLSIQGKISKLFKVFPQGQKSDRILIQK